MEPLSTLHCCHQPLHLSVNPQRPSFPKPISSISFRAPFPASSPFKTSSIRASCQNPKPSPSSLSTSVIRTASISLTVAATLFLTRLQTKPAIAAPPTVVESSSSTTTATDNNVSLEEQERALEKHIAQNPKDTEALRSLVEVRIKSRKLLEAIEIVDLLVELEPNDDEWSLIKCQIYSHSGDFESARKGFEEIIAKDPLRVAAYHGLVTASAEADNLLDDVVKRVELAMDKCTKENKISELREFKLLAAQIKVMEENFADALRVYEELVKEEPRDFRPYLFQGIIYTLLRKKDEAKKKFEQVKKLVPNNHPFGENLVDKMLASGYFPERWGGREHEQGAQ